MNEPAYDWDEGIARCERELAALTERIQVLRLTIAYYKHCRVNGGPNQVQQLGLRRAVVKTK